MTRISGWLVLPALISGAPLCNVREYGAAGDGVRKETPAIMRAIDACARGGGGTVYFPPGRYLTGAVELRSGVTLELEAGATLLGSEDPADYPVREDPWGTGARQISSLIYGAGVANVGVRGRGTIDGQGAVWWKWQREKNPARLPYGRPHLIRFVRASHVTLEGITLINSPSWTVHPLLSEFVTVRGVTIINPPDSPNTDGVNPESCRNVHISDCNIDVGDDCVTLKSGKDELGRKMGRPDENITVTNCTMLHGHGGIVIGSEMSGGVRNVAVTNCVFQGTQRGVRIKSQRGRGGVVEGVTVSNIVMQDVAEPFSITLYYSGRAARDQIQPVSEGTPRFRDILLNNITARGAKTAGYILGLREMPVEGVSFSHVRIQAEKGFLCEQARDITFQDVVIDTAAGPALTGRGVQGLALREFRTRRPHPGSEGLAVLRDTTEVK